MASCSIRKSLPRQWPANCALDEIAVPVRYFKEASSASFVQSSIYGLKILWLLAKYMAHKTGIHCSRQFESLDRRYRAANEQEAKAHGGV